VNPVFLDTVGLIALWDEDDQWHDAASHAFGRLVGDRAPLMTTCYILAECGNAVARTTMRLEVDVLRARLEAAGRLIFPTDEDWRSAWEGAIRQRIANLFPPAHRLVFVVSNRHRIA
jgi:predicted nucleic acid-binding protein